MIDDMFDGMNAQFTGKLMWRIENKKPVRFDAFTNKLHVGDSYLVLNSVKKGSSSSIDHKIHFWLGSETSVDEKGIVAYKAVELDDKLGGIATQIRETQGNETSDFLSYFKDKGGIEYCPGGVESGFRHVERDVYTTRLLHVKGKRVCRVKEVPVSSSSLNKGDAFILDMGLQIFVFFGPDCNKYEKIKALEVCRQINDDERGARGDVIRVNDDSAASSIFWDNLGGYIDPNSLPEGASDDTVGSYGPNRLLKISDAESGVATCSEITVPDGKLKKDMLDTNDNFIVISQGNVFIWIGRGSTIAEKREAMPAAIKFVESSSDIENSAKIERVSEGTESSKFRAAFSVWTDPRSIKTWKAEIADPLVQVPIDVSEILANTAKQDAPMEADTGSEKIKVYTISNFKPQPIDEEMFGQFFSGDSYIITYDFEVKRRKQSVIFFWLGSDSSQDEIGAAALETKRLDDELYGGNAVQVRVVQGKEPSQLRSIFKGNFIVHSGGLASGFKNKKDVDSKDIDGIALFHVRGTTELNTYGVQVAETASELNGEDAFVLVNPSNVYCWSGNACTSDERRIAKNIATTLMNTYLGIKDRSLVDVSEGEEPEEFWSTLGGKASYPAFAPGSEPPRNPRLFQCSNNIGIDEVEEIADFGQEDLNNDDTFILDTFTTLYVWIGSGSSQKEKVLAAEIATKFLQADSSRDTDTPIVQVSAGNEPSSFSCNFISWDPELFEKNTFKDPYAAKLAAMDAMKKASRGGDDEEEATPTPSTPSQPAFAAADGSFDYAALKAGIPNGVDPSRKESYLNESEFQTVFKMPKAEFEGLANWKKVQKKKEVGLF
jgi:hypothetical protein